MYRDLLGEEKIATFLHFIKWKMSLNLNNMHDQLMNNKNGASNVKGIFKEAYMNLDEHALQLSMFGKRQEASF